MGIGNMRLTINEGRIYMLRKIELVNYKSYDDVSIALKPITLLCGGNSSGKTSILKSVLLMKQSFEASGNNYLLINGPYTNNGLFSSIQRNTCPSNSEMKISMVFVIDNKNSSFKDLCRSIGMLHRQGEFQKFEIEASFQFDENPSIPQVGEIKSSTITLSSYFRNESNTSHDKLTTAKICMERCLVPQHYTIDLSNFPTPLYSRNKDAYPFEYMDHSWKDCVCYFRGMQLVSLYKDQLSKKSTSTLPVLYTIFRIIASEYNKIEYIGPLREAPLRQYLLQDVYSEIGVKGENTAHFLGQLGENIINCPLPGGRTSRNIKLKEAVAQWANFMGIEQVSIISTDIPGAKLTQIMIGNQNIADVGFGVSQVLPILVEGLTMPSGDTLILEQPEIHLHPKMQMNIADFLVMIAKQGKHLIVETHSDHIINRIVRRALESDELRSMIGIYYIEKNSHGDSKLTEVLINENLGIDDAPEGFFDQYASETEQILQTGYKNMKEKRGDKYDKINY